MSATNKIDKKNMSLFHMTWPLFIELFLQMLAGTADQVMLSSFNQTAVSAVGNANQVINLLLLFFTMVNLATTILVSIYLGAGDKENVSKIYTLAVVLNIVVSVIISFVVILGQNLIFSLMQIPEELLPECRSYLTIICIFLPFQAIFLTFSAIFKANTFMKKAMIAAIVVNALNIFGNYLLINGVGFFPRLGIAGAAISTSFSRMIGTILVIFMFLKSGFDAKISLNCLKPFPWELLKKFITIGVPSGGETISYNASQIVIQSFINTMGNDMIRLKVYATTLAWVAYVFALATSQASQIICGYMIGRGEVIEARKRTNRTFFCSVPISIFITLLILTFCRPIYTLLNCNELIIHTARYILLIEIFLEIGRAGNMIFIRGLQAAGDVVYPVVVGIVFQWFVSVVFGYLFGIVFQWGIIGIWMAMACDEIFRAVIFSTRWNSLKWKRYCNLK